MATQKNKRKKVNNGTNAENAKAMAWEDVEKMVAARVDLSDKDERRGYEQWREDAMQKRAMVDEMGDVVVQFTAKEVIDAAIDACVADIKDNAAINRRKHTANVLQLKTLAIQNALGEAQGVYVDQESGERVILAAFAVVREAKAKKAKVFRRVVDASSALARISRGEAAEQPAWPVAMVDGIKQYVDDLAEFLSTNGTDGCDLVLRICGGDRGLAKKVQDDSDAAKCLRYLAQLVVDYGVTSGFPAKGRTMGFAPASAAAA